MRCPYERPLKSRADYGGEENEWIPGSPGTTGSALLGRDWGAPNVVDLPRDPVQTFDWAGPLAAVQMGMSLPTNRVDRWKELITGIFECPSNRFIAESFNDNPRNFPDQKIVSYNMMRNMLYWDSCKDAPKLDQVGDCDGGGGSVQLHRPPQGPSEIPTGYEPKINRLGNPSEKVFIADGSRYTTDEGDLDYNVDWKPTYGGSFADGGPTVGINYLTSYDVSEPKKFFAYRHRKGRKSGKNTIENGDKTNGLVASFWDGHAEWMSAQQSRLPDRWWPKGSKLPLSDINPRSILSLSLSVNGDLTAFSAMFPNNVYTVRR